MAYLVVNANNVRESYQLTNTWSDRPAIKVSNSYLPLTSNTSKPVEGITNTIGVKVNNSNFRIMKYHSYTVEGSSYTVNTTVNMYSSTSSTYQTTDNYNTYTFSYVACNTERASYRYSYTSVTVRGTVSFKSFVYDFAGASYTTYQNPHISVLGTYKTRQFMGVANSSLSVRYVISSDSKFSSRIVTAQGTGYTSSTTSKTVKTFSSLRVHVGYHSTSGSRASISSSSGYTVNFESNITLADGASLVSTSSSVGTSTTTARLTSYEAITESGWI